MVDGILARGDVLLPLVLLPAWNYVLPKDRLLVLVLLPDALARPPLHGICSTIPVCSSYSLLRTQRRRLSFGRSRRDAACELEAQ